MRFMATTSLACALFAACAGAPEAGGDAARSATRATPAAAPASAAASGEARPAGAGVPAGQAMPGTRVMAERKNRIRYDYADLPRGGEVRITTADPEALRAIHAFMSAQRGDHRAGGIHP